MTLSLDNNPAHYQIRGYSPGHIQVNENILNKSIIISAKSLITDWPPQHLSDLRTSHLDEVRQIKPAIFLLGTGEKLIFPELNIYGELINDGIGVEIMDTRVACYTYNALSAEGRDVVAALIIF